MRKLLSHRAVRRRALTLCTTMAGATALFIGATGSNARADAAQVPFAGTALANAVQIRLQGEGFPVTDTPIDGGGPSAQAALSTFGSSQARALFPDPGEGAAAPGLIAGLLSGGPGGLPPIQLPATPPYPLGVSSDAQTQPEADAGSGPYRLKASSSTAVSKALAQAGGQSDAAGNALSGSAESVVASQPGGGAQATGATDMIGISIGPLTIGQIRTTAGLLSDATGALTRTSSAEISGVKIGGVPVDIVTKGLAVGGNSYPVPVSDAAAQALAAAHITLSLSPGRTDKDLVVSPALVISTPVDFDQQGASRVHGTIFITLGATSAQLDTSAPSVSVAGVPVGPGLAGPGRPASPTPAYGSIPDVAIADGATTALPGSPAEPGDPRSAPSAPTVGVALAAGVGQPLSFDLDGLYLMVLAAGGAAVFSVLFLRRTGVRPWTSTAG